MTGADFLITLPEFPDKKVSIKDSVQWKIRQTLQEAKEMRRQSTVP
jgi:hypothetical protein